MSGSEPYSDNSGAEPVRGFLHPAESTGFGSQAGLVLTHSAGGNCRAPLLVALTEAFAAAGLTVLRCDLPFRQDRPTGPPLSTASRDQNGLRAAVDALRRTLKLKPGEDSPDMKRGGSGAGRVFLGGHSYGGRMASMVAADDPELVEGLLLLAYPLHPPRQPQQLRTNHFAKLRTPALFVSGERDGFGSITELEEAAALIPVRTQVLPVSSAGHELLTKANRDTLPAIVVDGFMEFAGIRRQSGG